MASSVAEPAVSGAHRAPTPSTAGLQQNVVLIETSSGPSQPGINNIKHKDKILEAIDQLRRRKARPDLERICNFLFRRYSVGSKETLAELQRLVDAEIVIKVEYKGNTSYRNAAKWTKYAMYKSKELKNNNLSSEVHNILNRAFATVLVQDPDYLDIGVPRNELEKFMLQDDPLTDLAEIDLILTKETMSGFLVRLKNGNYSLADHPVPANPNNSSNNNSSSMTLQAKNSQEVYSVNCADKLVKPKPTFVPKEKKPKQTNSSPASAKDTEITASVTIDGHRVGMRRKTAKKVFDPSDNYTPTRKRGRPPGSTTVKKEASYSAVCCICSNNSGPRKVSSEKLIACRVCTNRAHINCILGKSNGKEKSQLSGWTCISCKLCAFCFETGENEAMAMCGSCGDAYHLTCHNPTITDEEWKGKWTCSQCVGSKSSTKVITASIPKTTESKSPEIKRGPIFDSFIKNKKEKIPDVSKWNMQEVFNYLTEKGFVGQAKAFLNHEIDGHSLLLLTRNDVLYQVGLKLGPALKVYHQVQLLQTKDIKRVYPFCEMLQYKDIKCKVMDTSS